MTSLKILEKFENEESKLFKIRGDTVMSEVLFSDKNIKPNDDLLSKKIGKSFECWVEIQKHVKSNFENMVEE